VNPDFERLKRGLRDLGSDQMLHDLSNLAGQAIVEQVQVGFDTESDPYGVPWRPSRAAQREGRKTLTDTRKLRDGIVWRADVRDVVVKTSGLPRTIGYDRFNQYGTRSTVARPYLPQDDLPPRFEKAIVTSFTAYLNSKYGST